MTSPTPRHWALAAEAITGGPHHERDTVERVAHLLASTEKAALDAAFTAGYATAQDEHREQQQAAQHLAHLADTARSDPRLARFAADLRAHRWQPRTPYACGCGPETLCPPHTALRDTETTTATTRQRPNI